MDWASMIIAILSVLVAGGSVWVALQARRAAERSAEESKRANDLTVLYKDPFWELTSETAPVNNYAGGPRTELRLTNRGESPGREVSISFDFDPAHMHIPAQGWSFIDRGAYESFGTLFELPIRGTGGGGSWNSQVAHHSARNMATVSWTSPAGERKEQRVKLPECHRYQDPVDSA
jgi:hypothetical protein